MDGAGDKGYVSFFPKFFYCSGAVVNCPFMTDVDTCCICFIVPFLLSLSLVPLIRHC